MRKIVIDLDTDRILEVDGKVRKGECKRCGKCCDRFKCPYLIRETLDGKPVARCEHYFKRPFACVLWPLPEQMVKCPDDCGFYWEDKE